MSHKFGSGYSRMLLTLAVSALVGAVVVGCAQLSDVVPLADRTSPQIATAEGAGATSCGSSLSELTGSEREAAIQQALESTKVQSLIQELANRGFTVDASAATAYMLNSEKLVWLPAGPTAGIVYETYLGAGYAVAAVQDGNKTINIRPDQGVHHMAGFDPKTRYKLFRQLRSNKQIHALEKSLKKQDQLIDWNKSVLIVDIEGGNASVGLAVRETNSSKPAWFGYRVEATVKSSKLTVKTVQAESCGHISASAFGGRDPKIAPEEEFTPGDPGIGPEPGWTPVEPPIPPYQVCIGKAVITPDGTLEYMFICI